MSYPQVQVELKKGETIMIEAALHLPAACLHEAFCDRSGVPPDHFELYYRGKRLESEASLSSRGVDKDATIEVKMRGLGGGDKKEKQAVAVATEGKSPSSSKVNMSDSIVIKPAQASTAHRLPRPTQKSCSKSLDSTLTLPLYFRCPYSFATLPL